MRYMMIMLNDLSSRKLHCMMTVHEIDDDDDDVLPVQVLRSKIAMLLRRILLVSSSTSWSFCP